MRYARLPSGKIKYYWVNQDPVWIYRDQIEGINGVRKWLLDVIPDHESILDIGCGPGHVSEIFKSAGRKNDYLGVDHDLETIEFAKSFFPQANFERQDANFLPFKDGSFDNCILFTVVEMLFDFRKAVEEAARVAGKRVIITTFIPPVDDRDQNNHIINNLGDYVVNINRKKLESHLNQFGKVSSGELVMDGKIEYWWWMIEK